MSKLIFKKANIFNTECVALVCPVNCIGVMGAGLAKAFKDNKKFSGANEAYKQACNKGELAPGGVVLGVTDLEATKENPYVFYLATKFIYSDDSKLEYIEHGLLNLMKALDRYKINSVAIPAIGAGLGKLPWSTVQLMIKTVFESDGNPNRIVEIYEPM